MMAVGEQVTHTRNPNGKSTKPLTHDKAADTKHIQPPGPEGHSRKGKAHPSPKQTPTVTNYCPLAKKKKPTCEVNTQ